jgi:hypothetical protein
LKVIDLPGKSVLRAQQVIRAVPQLSINDGFAFVLAESHGGCILLTADSHLRKLAVKHRIEVHGILWALDQIHVNRLSTGRALHAALCALERDPAVRLPCRRRRKMARISRTTEASEEEADTILDVEQHG